MQQNIRIPLLVGLAAIAVGALIVQGMNITPAALATHHHHHHHGHHHSSISVHQSINEANVCSNSACSNTGSNTANIH